MHHTNLKHDNSLYKPKPEFVVHNKHELIAVQIKVTLILTTVVFQLNAYDDSVAGNGNSMTELITGISIGGFQVSLLAPTSRWRNPETNPYITRVEERNTVTSRYRDVAMALSHA